MSIQATPDDDHGYTRLAPRHRHSHRRVSVGSVAFGAAEPWPPGTGDDDGAHAHCQRWRADAGNVLAIAGRVAPDRTTHHLCLSIAHASGLAGMATSGIHQASAAIC